MTKPGPASAMTPSLFCHVTTTAPQKPQHNTTLETVPVMSFSNCNMEGVTVFDKPSVSIQ